MKLKPLMASRRGMALPNAVFFGPPGTGKSLTARRLAECCGMDWGFHEKNMGVKVLETKNWDPAIIEILEICQNRRTQYEEDTFV